MRDEPAQGQQPPDGGGPVHVPSEPPSLVYLVLFWACVAYGGYSAYSAWTRPQHARPATAHRLVAEPDLPAEPAWAASSPTQAHTPSGATPISTRCSQNANSAQASVPTTTATAVREAVPAGYAVPCT